MIELKDSTYLLAIWFVSWREANWMCAVYRHAPEDDWTVRYRFRYFEDERVFDSDDRRSWYAGTLPSSMTEDMLIAKFDMFASVVGLGRGASLERLLVKGGMEDLKRAAEGCEWFNFRTEHLERSKEP